MTPTPDINDTSARRLATASRTRRAYAWLILPVVVATACSSGRPPERAHADTPAPQSLAVTPVTTGDVAVSFEAGGVVRAKTTATLSARLMAPVLSVQVKAGDAVKRGDVLLTLDAREMAAYATRGRAAAVAADEAARAASAQVAAAEAGLRLARATHDRISGLQAKQSATAHELDQAVAALQAAEAQTAAARAQVAAASAAREAAQAAASAADINVSYTTIAAPFDGTVVARHVDPGTLATPGAPLFILEQRGASRLEVSLDEARAGRVTVGQASDVQLDGLGGPGGPGDGRGGKDGSWLRATVAEIGRIDATSHSFVVKLDLPADVVARSGAFGRARFLGDSRRALTVPAASVVRRGQLAFVFVVGSDRLARLRPISPGPTVGDRTEVLAGLRDGDAVVTGPPADLRDGTPIAGTTADAGGQR